MNARPGSSLKESTRHNPRCATLLRDLIDLLVLVRTPEDERMRQFLEREGKRGMVKAVAPCRRVVLHDPGTSRGIRRYCFSGQQHVVMSILREARAGNEGAAINGGTSHVPQCAAIGGLKRRLARQSVKLFDVALIRAAASQFRTCKPVSGQPCQLEWDRT